MTSSDDTVRAYFTPQLRSDLARASGADSQVLERRLPELAAWQFEQLRALPEDSGAGRHLKAALASLGDGTPSALGGPGAAALESQGRSLAGRLLPDLGGHDFGLGDSATRVHHLTLPLVLDMMRRGGAAGLAGAGVAGAGLAGAAAVSVQQGAPVHGAVPDVATGPVQSRAVEPATPAVVVQDGEPVRAAPAPAPAPAPVAAAPVAAAPVATASRGFNPLWLLLLIPLLLLLWWLLTQNRQPVATTEPVTTQTTTTQTTTTLATPAAGAATPPPAAPLPATAVATDPVAVTQPAAGATVPGPVVQLAGVAPAGETVAVSEGGAVVGSATAGADGRWALALDNVTPGEKQWVVSAQGREVIFPLTVLAAEAAADAAGLPSAGPVEAVTLNLQPGAAVPAEGFELAGQGVPNATHRIFEDGAFIGDTQANAQGGFSARVVSPTPGERQYAVTDAPGNVLATVPLNVQGAVAAANCDAVPFSLSLSDGQVVSAPYRFGGQGSAPAYTVTVNRGERTVGQVEVPLGANCTWSYLSTPGGEEGELGPVTYTVTPVGGDTPAASITLTVEGSGVNFVNGEYVGPTGN